MVALDYKQPRVSNERELDGLETELTIGQVGLSEVDCNRLKQIMSTAVTKNAFRHRWVLAQAGSADFLVVAADSVEGVRVDAPGMAVMAGAAETVPDGCKRISWPLRYEELIPMLHTVENSVAVKRTPGSGVVSAVTPRLATSVRDADPASQLTRLAMMIREGAGVGMGNRAWKVNGMTATPVYFVPGERYFYLSGSIAALRNLTADSDLRFQPVATGEVDTTIGKMPLVMLQWIVGIKYGHLGLLPWLRDKKAYKLKRYPAFETLRHTPEHRRIAAALMRPRKSVRHISKLIQVDENVVAGFVNASSICGYLVTADPRIVNAISKTVEAPRRALLQSFRKALGILSTND